jgi:hypothetical protein
MSTKKRIVSPFLLSPITAIFLLEAESPSFLIEMMPLRGSCLREVLVEMSQTRILAFYSLVPAKIVRRSTEMARQEISAKVLKGDWSSLRNYCWYL